MDALCSIKSHIASFYEVVHLWTIDWVLFSDIHMQIFVSSSEFASILLPLIQLLLWQFGQVKTSSGQNLIIADTCKAMH